MRSLAKSNKHFERAVNKMPLGVSSNFRYWGDDKTIYVHHGKGGRVWDIDGNEYIDYRLAYGPIILGYADERVDEAAKKGMEVGGVFALSTELEYQVAQRISRMVPAAELVRFSNSGTEAVMAALRVARAYTGKDAHIALEGGYHGVFTEVACSSSYNKAIVLSRQGTVRLSASSFRCYLPCRWNIVVSATCLVVDRCWTLTKLLEQPLALAKAEVDVVVTREMRLQQFALPIFTVQVIGRRRFAPAGGPPDVGARPTARCPVRG